jgi:toxin ParE1/3/4
MSRKPVVLLAAARRDVATAYEWYEQERPGLGARFIASLDTCLKTMQAAPAMYPKVVSDCHKAIVRQFPYIVFYRAEEARIVVFAVMHTSRAPESWQTRLH